MSDSNHLGHRERVKKKLLEIGLDKFHEHEILEFLLFFGIPYKNTNIIAHNLIKKFGSFADVLEALVEDLIQIPGMTRNAAILLHTLPQVFREYRKSKLDTKNPIINIDDILPLLEANLQFRDMESLVVVCLNARQRITAVVEMGISEINSILLSPRSIVDIALRYKAVNLIIAHNHPSGNAIPSESDIAMTIDIKHMLKCIDVELVDHIIIADNKAYSFYLKREIRESKACNIKPYHMSNQTPKSLPRSTVVKVVKKEDGTFQRLV